MRPATANLTRPSSKSKPNSRKHVEEDKGFVIQSVGNKERRNTADVRSKWTVDEVRDDHVWKLEDHMIAAFGEVAAKKLFSNDFKTHVKCLESFK